MIINADAVKWAREYDGEKFHALLCDPPYEMGFMGKDWDKSGVPFDPATWEAFKSVLHDGAFGMAFASSRGWHRLAVAIEDAGFVIHPSIFGWSYGSGFPKATRIDTQVDKAAGAERTKIIERYSPDGLPYSARQPKKWNPAGFGESPPVSAKTKDTAPATPLAEAWAGHRYGLQALKPALEPIIVFQKPYKGKPVECITETGAGALNIDASRIEAEPELAKNWNRNQSETMNTERATYGKYKPVDLRGNAPSGRWPANFILDAEAARRLDEQSGERAAGNFPANNRTGFGGVYRGETTRKGMTQERKPTDSGGASRFFYNVAEQLDEADPVRYQAKASRKERDAGLGGMEAKIEPTNAAGRNKCIKCGGWAYNVGSAINRPKSTCFCDAPEFEFIPSRQIPVRNPHPTVKPLDLSRYLATLLLPPDLYAPRRIFVPFAGVGSEMIGAILAGWEEVVGVELTEEYIPIAEARIKHWSKRQLEF